MVELPALVQSFLAYSLVEYAINMGLIDNGVRIFLYKPEMSQESKMKLVLLELVAIINVGVLMAYYVHHVPLASILMIWFMLESTMGTLKRLARRYWNDFLEFENFKPRPTVPNPPIQAVPTSPTPEPVVRNGTIYDRDPNKQPVTPTQPLPVPVLHKNVLVQQPQTPARPTSSMFTIPGRQILRSTIATFRRVRNKPPGLENKIRKNLCSVNAVLQSLASTPLLAESLIREIPHVKDDGTLRDFITELGGLLSDLRRSSDPKLSTEHLLELANLLHSPQPQTDSVEWLMWLLDTVHSSFQPPGTSKVELNMQKMKLLRAVPLAQPLLILYEPSQVPNALYRMRNECLDKIEHAHGLQVSSYADPIQRYTEVEWLTHKFNNHSIIDEMFSGQVVEAQHCVACQHISASVQPFKVLPLAIPAIRHTRYMLSLQDCVNHFAAVEKLYGANGIQCKHCNAQRSQFNYATEPKLYVPFMRRTTLDSGVGGDSPLYRRGAESGFLSPIRRHSEDVDESVFAPEGGAMRTSSPINRQWSTQPQWQGLSPILDRSRCTSTPTKPRSFPPCDGERQSLISQLPDVLSIQLMRVMYMDGQPIKMTIPVTIPRFNLDLYKVTTESQLGGDHKSSANGCYKYNLQSIVIHLGENSVTHGHYITYAQINDGSWFCFDDNEVSPVNIDYELQTRKVWENACILYYRKVKVVC